MKKSPPVKMPPVPFPCLKTSSEAGICGFTWVLVTKTVAFTINTVNRSDMTVIIRALGGVNIATTIRMIMFVVVCS